MKDENKHFQFFSFFSNELFLEKQTVGIFVTDPIGNLASFCCRKKFDWCKV